MLRSRKSGSSTTTATTTVIPPAPTTEGSNSKPDDMMLRSTKKDKTNTKKTDGTPSKASIKKKPKGSQQWGNLAFAIANAKKAAEHAAMAHQKEYTKNAKVYRIKLCIYSAMCLGLLGVGWFFYPTMEPAAKQFYAEHKDMLNKPQELLRGGLTSSPHEEVDNQEDSNASPPDDSSGTMDHDASVTPPKEQPKTKADLIGEPDSPVADARKVQAAEGGSGGNLVGSAMPKACVTKIFRNHQPDFHDGTIVVDCHEYHYKADFDGMQGKLVIGVLSTTYRQRMFIRDSWGKLTDTKVYFIVNGPFARVEHEYAQSDDLIFIDKPSNQPKNPAINTLGFMLIAEQHGGAFENILLTTDDVFVNMKSVEKILNEGIHKEVATAYPTRVVSRAFSKCAVKAIPTEIDTENEPFHLLDLMAKDCGMPPPRHIESNSQIKDKTTMNFFYKQALSGNLRVRS